MKIRDTVGMLVGSGLVYVAMAACSAGGRVAGSGGSGGHHVASGSGGAQGAGGEHGAGGDDGGIFDALTDPVPEAAAEPVSGSRLKAKYQVADDGLKVYLPGTYYDSERGEDCSFVMTADGKQRCLPFGDITANVYFLDASCTKGLAVLAAGCTPTTARYFDPIACPGSTIEYRFYKLGAQVMPAKAYIKSGVSCTETSTTPTLAYFPLSAEVPLSSFVAGSVQHD